MGDLRNSRARLKTLLKSVQYPQLHATRYSCIHTHIRTFSIMYSVLMRVTLYANCSLESASVQDLLQILHFALLDYSRAVAAFIQSKVSGLL